MNHRRAFALLALFSLIAGSRDIAAQRRIEIPPEPSCATCRIELERIVTLGAASDPASPDIMLGRVRRDRRGVFYVGPTESRSEILVYDSLGGYVRELGRAGDGPGEFRFIWHTLIDAHDSLHVFDAMSRRQTVLAPGTGAVARSVPFPVSFMDIIRLESGDFILSEGRPSRAGWAMMRHVAAGGLSLEGFGVEEMQESARGDAQQRARKLVAADGDRFWATNVYGRYEIELWSARDGRLGTLVRRHEWPVDSFQIAGMMLDEAGRLWVSISVRDPSWSPAPRAADPMREMPAPPRSERLQGMNTIIDVIDVERRRLIASVRRPEALQGFDGQNLLTRFRASPVGIDLIDVYRVRLVER